MARIVECVPNFSEGRDEKRVQTIADAIAAKGVRLLDVQRDDDHNRSVVSFIGTPEACLEAAFAGAEQAVKLIDLNKHQGAHPRIGSVDVIPFVPIQGVEMSECVELAKRLGERLWSKLELPVYFYEEAATMPERRNLEAIRKGQYEALKEEVKTKPERRPDLGEARLHETAGAVVVGARPPLIAYNINLQTSNVEVAKAIAKAIRHSSGGYRHVKAMGLELKDRGIVQVSMNLTDFRKTPIHRVFETVKREAARYGVNVVGSEIVGLVPMDALVEAAEFYLQIEGFRGEQVIERRLLEE